MADTFVEKVIDDGPHKLVKSFSYTHVDTGQSAVMAIDVSGLSTLQDGTACTGVRINKIWFSTTNIELNILWEAASYLWNGLLTIGGAVIVLFIKSHHSNVQRIEILLNKTREQVARDYVNKTDLTADMNRIFDRFDRLEDKIDSFMKG